MTEDSIKRKELNVECTRFKCTCMRLTFLFWVSQPYKIWDCQLFTSIVNASYVWQMDVSPHNQSFESNHSLPESLVPPISSSLGKLVTGSTSIPKRLPKQPDDTTWNARYLTFHSTILAKRRQKKTGQILSLTSSNHTDWRCCL